MIVLKIIQWIITIILVLFLFGCVLAIFFVPWAIMKCRKEQEREPKGELPWYCIIIDKPCSRPECRCDECDIYEEFMEATEEEL